MADTIYFGMPGIGLGATAVHNYAKNDKPAQLTGLWIDRWLQKYLAFIDGDYRLSMLLPRLDHGWRKGVDSPYDDVWKIGEMFPGRQFVMWDQIEQPGYLQTHARLAWHGFKGPVIPPAVVNKVIARSAEAVRRIRARGGDVIFIRPPSAPQLRVNEQQRIPRKLGWDRLLAGVPAKGIHADDLPQAQNLVIPGIVAPQRQMRDGVHRRLCAAAGAADAAAEAAGGRAAAAQPRRLRSAEYRLTVARRLASTTTPRASTADRQAMKIVSSPQIVPTISASFELSSAKPMSWAEPGGVLITTRLPAGSTDRTHSRNTAARRGEAPLLRASPQRVAELSVAADLDRADLLEVARDGRLGNDEAEGTETLRQLFLADQRSASGSGPQLRAGGVP